MNKQFDAIRNGEKVGVVSQTGERGFVASDALGASEDIFPVVNDKGDLIAYWYNGVGWVNKADVESGKATKESLRAERDAATRICTPAVDSKGQPTGQAPHC
jgi:hypothetical protein